MAQVRKNYCPGKPNDRLVPGTEYIADREANNFCEDFSALGKRTRRPPKIPKMLSANSSVINLKKGPGLHSCILILTICFNQNFHSTTNRRNARMQARPL